MIIVLAESTLRVGGYWYNVTMCLFYSIPFFKRFWNLRTLKIVPILDEKVLESECGFSRFRQSRFRVGSGAQRIES